MKWFFNICTIFIIYIFITGCTNRNNENLNKNNELILSHIYAYKLNQCNEEKEFYFEDNNYTYYKVCIDYVSISYKNIKLDSNFKDAILNDGLSLEDIIESSKEKLNFNSYSIYKYNNFNIAIKENQVLLIDNMIDYEYYLSK